jgi:CHAD domain-containing protein
MAKAADIELTPFEPYARAGARVVRVRAQEVFDHADGVLDTQDIERVHDMRVATRRLRAVLEIFAPCFPKAEFKAALSDIKDLADALGERRDPDVHIEDMEKLTRGLPAAQRPGVRALVERLRERQLAGNAAVAAALQHTEDGDLHGRLRALADAAEELLAE